MNCCICGPVKNCEPYLYKVLYNMEKIGSIFDDYKIIIYYDNSSDNTLKILKDYQKKNNKMIFYVNKNKISPYRTHNIAIARNFCLNYVKQNIENYPFFIMMDCDDVNCKEVNIDILKKYIYMNNWDGLSFNTKPKYYDIWGLSIYPFCFSYNHFENNVKYYDIIQNYIDKILKKAESENKLVECISSFNGFSIYRTNKFLNTYYDGRVRLDIVPIYNMIAHKNATKSKLIFKQYHNEHGKLIVDGKYEDCEHRAFHIQARQNSNARIMISPEVLFH
jgi:hypothetical protein